MGREKVLALREIPADRLPLGLLINRKESGGGDGNC